MKSWTVTSRVWDLPYADHPYIDLRRYPARIDEIPELKYEPRLKALISTLNDPTRMFMTHACAVASQRPGIAGCTEIRIPYGAQNARSWYTSYVCFSLWFFRQNRPEQYRAIYDAYPPDRNRYSLCFELQPVYFLTPHERQTGTKSADSNAVVCCLWLSGWGNDGRESQDRWDMGLKELVAFFERVPANLLEVSSPSGITLSEHISAETLQQPHDDAVS